MSTSTDHRTQPEPGSPDHDPDHGPAPDLGPGSGRDRSTAELVGALSDQLTRLVKAEIRLATTELKTKGRRAGAGTGLAAAGVLIALFATGTLVAAVVLGLATAAPAWLAALLVGTALLLVAAALTTLGLRRLRAATPPIPEQAIDSSRQNIETVKASVRR